METYADAAEFYILWTTTGFATGLTLHYLFFFSISWWARGASRRLDEGTRL